jgi:hypothetical protein
MKRRYFRPTGTIIQVGRLIAAPSDLGFADSGCRHLLQDHSHVAAEMWTDRITRTEISDKGLSETVSSLVNVGSISHLLGAALSADE